MVRAVIIDFDDTLVQTSRFRRGLLETALRNWNRISNDEIITLDWGQPFYHMIETFIGTDKLKTFMDYYKNIMRQNPIKPCIGAERFLRGLHQRQIPIVILSSSVCELIEFDLDTLGFSEMITNVFDSEMVEKPKPSPHALQLPLKWLQENFYINPSQCIYVGDSLVDMECSLNQIDFFAVLSGSVSRQDFLLNGLPENRIIDNLDDLYYILTDN